MPTFRDIDKKITHKILNRLGTDKADYFDGENAVTIFGIFDKGFQEILDVAGSHPQFTAKTNDMPHVRHGHHLTILESTYDIVGSQPDGLSITTLLLEEQS